MCQVICCVMTAVVAWRSRVGASPMSPALSTPPMRGWSCANAPGRETRVSSESSATTRISMKPSSERLDVGPAVPGEVGERHFRLRPILEADHHGLLEHAERAHLARHAALAAAVGLAGRAHLGQVLAKLIVGGELVEKAALEPAAVAEEPAIRERHVLGLGHLDGDGIEALQIRRAAELPAAGADAIHELGGVARSDLAHLDAGVELVSEVADEIAEVHALLRAEEHGDAAMARIDLHVHDLEPEPASLRAAPVALGMAQLALAPVVPFRDLGLGRPSDHLAIEPAALELREEPLGPAHFAHCRPLPRLDHDEVADVQIIHVRLVVLGLQRLAHAQADEIWHIRFGFRRCRFGSLDGLAHDVLTPPGRGGSAAPRR